MYVVVMCKLTRTGATLEPYTCGDCCHMHMNVCHYTHIGPMLEDLHCKMAPSWQIP